MPERSSDEKLFVPTVGCVLSLPHINWIGDFISKQVTNPLRSTQFDLYLRFWSYCLTTFVLDTVFHLICRLLCFRISAYSLNRKVSFPNFWSARFNRDISVRTLALVFKLPCHNFEASMQRQHNRTKWFGHPWSKRPTLLVFTATSDVSPFSS